MYLGNIIFLGSPGSGKGTISNLLKEKYGYVTITTGDILRAEKNSGSEVGNQINHLIGKGHLVSDDLINKIVENKIKSLDSPYILDGFPRTIPQGEFLEKIADIGLVIYLDVTDETIKRRILERGKISGREDDQDITIIERRIKQFKEETKPLINFYKKKFMITYVDGEAPIEQVLNQVENILRLWDQ